MSETKVKDVLDERAGVFRQVAAPIGGGKLPTYEVTLGSGAVVVMRAWPLGHSLAEVQSEGSRIDRLRRLLDVCLERVVDPGPYQMSGRWNWDDVLFSDWDAAIIAARIATHGPILRISQPCPNNTPARKESRCQGHMKLAGPDPTPDSTGFAIDLDRLLRNDVWEIPEETREALARGENRFELSWDGVDVEFMVPTGRTWRSIEAGLKDPQRSREKATWAVACKILSLEGRTERTDIMRALKDPALPGSFAGALEAMDEWDGGLLDTLQVYCPLCGWSDSEFRLPFEQAPEFYAPKSPKKSSGARVPKRRLRKDRVLMALDGGSSGVTE